MSQNTDIMQHDFIYVAFLAVMCLVLSMVGTNLV